MSAAIKGRWSAEWIALAGMLSVSEVFRAHTSDMGAPGDFFMEGARTVYTDSGLRKLAVGLEELGYVGAAEVVRRKLEPARLPVRWYEEDLWRDAA